MEGIVMRIGLLNNLRAGQNVDGVAELLASLKRFPEVSHIETSSSAAVAEALWDFAAEGVELLVVNGGDGTLQAVLTEILDRHALDGRVPLLAPLRGGRTNMTALDLGTQRNSIRALTQLVEATREGRLEERVVKRPVLRVEHSFRPGARYGMFFGAGTIYRATQLVHRIFPRGRAQGVFGGTLVTAALLGRLAAGRDPGRILAPDKARVLLDGEPMRDDQFTLLMASSLDRLFARMRPFWGPGHGGVRFTSIAKGAEQVWRAAPGMLMGRPATGTSEENGYISRRVHCAEIARSCGYSLDGELVDPTGGGVVSVTATDPVRFLRA
jgi:diacylglycerol kinase (ATP)